MKSHKLLLGAIALIGLSLLCLDPSIAVAATHVHLSVGATPLHLDPGLASLGGLALAGVLTETRQDFGFLVSEANGTRSRETKPIKRNQGTLVPGQLLQDDGSGNMQAFTGAVNTLGELIKPVAGILAAETATPTGAEINAVVVVRDAEVNLSELTYPAATTDVDIPTLAKKSLNQLGIAYR